MRLRRSSPLSVALEAIDFNHSASFYKELTAACAHLGKAAAADVGDHEVAKQLPSVIKHHTGLNVSMYFGESLQMASASPLVNHNNPLLNMVDIYTREEMPNLDADQLLAKAKSSPLGRVNLKTGMVSGVFSDFPCIITIDSGMMTNGAYTPEEKAAVILHEIGHLETYFEFISRTVSTNQILGALSKKYEATGSIKEREMFLTKLKSQEKLNDLDVEALAKSTDKRVAEVVIVSSITKKIESELGSNLYDMTQWEQLADQYATRQGAGRALITLLDKRGRERNDVAFRGLTRYLFIEGLKLALALATPFTGGFSLALMACACLYDAESTEGIYDNAKNRFGRVRDQLVEALKDTKLKPEVAINYRQDIAAIDQLLSQVKDRQQLLGYVMDFISPYHRKRTSQEKLQRDLERLAHNDLFVRAANLKQLASA